MSKPITGIIHVHSDFSSDGFYSIAYLADFARDLGFGFVGITDHAEDLSPGDMKDLQGECERHSGKSVVIIPGLEFRCQPGIHILGLGITHRIHSDDPVAVAEEIGLSGGLAILAHPSLNGYQYPGKLSSVLNGIEIWNAGYDGRFAPPLASLRLLQEVRGLNPAIYGFGGVDLHILHQPPRVLTELWSNGIHQVEPRMILQYLRSGRFTVRGKYVSLDAHGGPHSLSRPSVWAFRKLYEVATGIRNIAMGVHRRNR